MNGKQSKRERRLVKQKLDEKIAESKILKIDHLVGKPPTLQQYKRGLRAKEKICG